VTVVQQPEPAVAEPTIVTNVLDPSSISSDIPIAGISDTGDVIFGVTEEETAVPQIATATAVSTGTRAPVIATIGMGNTSLGMSRPASAYFNADRSDAEITSISLQPGYKLELSQGPPDYTIEATDQPINANFDSLPAKYYKLSKKPECKITLVEGFGLGNNNTKLLLIVVIFLVVFWLYNRRNTRRLY
jgi:hypothetical protein